MKKFMWIAMLFCAVWYSQASAVVIFSAGGFEEQPAFSNWTSTGGVWATSGGNVHTGGKRAQAIGPTNSAGDVLLLVLPAGGFKDLSLEFWYRIADGLESADHLFAEFTADGASWQQLADITGPVMADWQMASINLPAQANDNPLLQLRFRAVLGAGSDAVHLDDVQVLGQLVPEPATMILLLFAPLVVARRKSRS